MPALLALDAHTDGVADYLRPLRPHNEADADAALHAARRLANAISAHLLAFDRQGGRLTVIAGTGRDSAGPDAPELLACIEPDMRIMGAETQPHWVPATEGRGAALVVKVVERGLSSVFLALGFSDSTAVSRARVSKIVPDLVTLLARQLDLETKARRVERERAAIAAALDQRACGVIAVRADHSVVFANAVASAMLAGREGLQLRREAVRPTHYPDMVRFQAALDAVAEPDRFARSARGRAFVMLLTPEGERHPKIAVIAPVSAAARAAADAEDAVAIIYVVEPDNGKAPGVEALCQLHGLSRVETRLVCHLCAGLTLNEAAADMRIKVETARAYLKQVFAKTGAHRQTDLIALMTRYLPPLHGDFDLQPA